MGRSSVTDQFVRTVGTFSVLGPLVGTGVAWLGFIAVLVPAVAPLDAPLGGLLLSLLGTVVLSLVVGYVVGLIPAAVTGVVCHMFAQSIRSDRAWIGACALVGLVCGGVAPPVLGLFDPVTVLLLGLCGGVAGAVCGWKLRRARWPEHPWKP